MLKEAIQHIQKTTQPCIYEANDRRFCVTTDGDITEIRTDTGYPATLDLSSLDALVKLVQTEALPYVGGDGTVYITVPNHLTVQCFTEPNYEERGYRHFFYNTRATDVPGWDSKVQLPFEEMQIALRTRFQETADSQYVMKLLSEISTGAKITMNDNGIATTIVTKKGIDLQANEIIRPIVTLKPYRTFQEVDQPESTFLIRISERGISFTEADGGMWKLKARQTVKAFLEERLAKEVSAGSVVIAL